MKDDVGGMYDSEVSYIPGTTLDYSKKNLKKRKKISCLGKVKFRKEKAARVKALLYDLEYYKCDFCNKWHLTRGEKGKRK